jgi:hypothetical protein
MERKLTGGPLFPCASGTRRAGWMVRWLLFFVLLGAGRLAAGAQGVPEAAPPRLQISAVERSGFPTIGLNLIATSAGSERRENLEGLRLWENGVPVADFSLEPVSVGVELFLLLDLESAWAETAEDGVSSPLLLIEDSLLRLAERHLERERDLLWLGAGGEETGWLQEAGDPAGLVAALDQVDAPPDRGSAPPDPAALLAMALDSAEATANDTGRFRAIVLFTTGEGLGATALQALAERAGALQLPTFVVLLGPPPLSTTLDAAAWITLPTRGGLLHLTSATAADALYSLLAANAAQTQLRYQSYVEPGRVYPLRVALGAEESLASLNLELQPPRPEIQLENGLEIRRAGLAPNSALETLQPAVQSVPVSLDWPDGVPRRLAEAALYLDGVVQPAPVLGDAATLQFEWDISALDEGSYALTVQVTDTAGLAATSPPVAVAIAVTLPQPTATPRPTAGPPPAAVASRPLSPALLLLAGVSTLLVAFLLIRWMRPAPFGDEGPPVRAGEQPFLLLPSGENWPLDKEVTLGRSGTDLILAGEGVAPLHARLAPGAEGGYWLYDEGSSAGTYVNGERLGLNGRLLRPGDELRFGDTTLRFMYSVLER